MRVFNKTDLAQPITANIKETIEVNIENSNGTVSTEYLHIPEKPVNEYEIDMWDFVNQFENKSWDSSNVGLNSGWPTWNAAFDGGIRPGLYFIAADSNIGKSHVINQLGQQLVDLNDDVFVLDFSLDDPKEDRFCRIVACTENVPINLVKSPHAFQDRPYALLKRQNGINRVRASVSKYKLFDSSDTSYIEDIVAEVKRAKTKFDEQGVHKKIVVLVDNFHDLTTRTQASLQDNAKYEYLASACADLAIREDIVVICTAELRKANGKMRPTPDDIRSASKIKYEAKAIILLYSDLHYRGEAAEVTYELQGKKMPVLECHFAKNKFGSFKGREYLHLNPNCAKCDEVDKQTAKKYTSQIFG